MDSTDLMHLATARRYAVTGAGARLRRSAHLSLQEIAEATGCSVTTVWRWEQGQRAPHGAPALAWARLLRELEQVQSQERGA